MYMCRPSSFQKLKFMVLSPFFTGLRERERERGGVNGLLLLLEKT